MTTCVDAATVTVDVNSLESAHARRPTCTHAQTHTHVCVCANVCAMCNW